MNAWYSNKIRANLAYVSCNKIYLFKRKDGIKYKQNINSFYK